MRKVLLLISILVIVSGYYFLFKKITLQEEVISKQQTAIYEQHKIISEAKYDMIKTDGNHSFKLNENDNLFFYTKRGSRDVDINIKGVLKNEKIVCYEIITKNSFKLKLSELSEKCKKAIYFIGEFNKIFFYFRLNQKSKNRSKNLLVLPSTNFFIYNNNIVNISPYKQKESFIINLNDIPFKSNDIWGFKTSESIHNISKIIKDFEIILDYEFQNFNLENYNLLIFPLHQEYMSKEFIEKFQNFLEKKNRAILSIGGANFMRDFKLKGENKIIIEKDKKVNNKYYNLNTFKNFKDQNCFYLDDDKFELGELTDPLINKDIEYFFPKIQCDNNKIIPLLSTQSFNLETNSKLIHILSDGIGINFIKIDYLKSKIVRDLNNILNN